MKKIKGKLLKNKKEEGKLIKNEIEGELLKKKKLEGKPLWKTGDQLNEIIGGLENLNESK